MFNSDTSFKIFNEKLIPACININLDTSNVHIIKISMKCACHHWHMHAARKCQRDACHAPWHIPDTCTTCISLTLPYRMCVSVMRRCSICRRSFCTNKMFLCMWTKLARMSTQTNFHIKTCASPRHCNLTLHEWSATQMKQHSDAPHHSNVNHEFLFT